MGMTERRLICGTEWTSAGGKSRSKKKGKLDQLAVNGMHHSFEAVVSPQFLVDMV
jgi:hypothetical protein